MKTIHSFQFKMRIGKSSFFHFRLKTEKSQNGNEKCERGLKETHIHCVIQLTPKTALEISSKEGREWGFDCKHAETS